MDYLYSLYDALVSINVPNDKARAVVDAMERDMGTTIATKVDLQAMSAATKADIQALSAATKADIQALGAATKADIQALSAATKADIQALSTATKADIQTLSTATKAETQSLRAEIQSLRADMQTQKQELLAKMATREELKVVADGVVELRQETALLNKEIELQSSRITLRLGSMLVGGFGVVLYAMRAWLA